MMGQIGSTSYVLPIRLSYRTVNRVIGVGPNKSYEQGGNSPTRSCGKLVNKLGKTFFSLLLGKERVPSPRLEKKSENHK